MTKIQFRVLYREFLFRLVDLEILSAQGDISKLLGQFGAVLIFLSFALSRSAVFLDPNMSPARLLSIQWDREYALIALTMVTVGLFAVLSWDSAFPDRRDVLVLAPLPVRARTLFLAKIAALATALSVTVLALNVSNRTRLAAGVCPHEIRFPRRDSVAGSVLDHRLGCRRLHALFDPRPARAGSAIAAAEVPAHLCDYCNWARSDCS